MRNRFFCLLASLLAIAVLSIRCKKEQHSKTINTDSAWTTVDTIPAELEQYLDSLPNSVAHNGSVYLSNGLTVDSILKLYDSTFYRITPDGPTSPATPPVNAVAYLIAHMLKEADNLTDRSVYTYAQDAIGPFQYGLAYVFGSKDMTERRQSQSATGVPGAGLCKLYLYGIDCSGLLYQCLTAAGLNIPEDQASVHNLVTSLIKNALAANPMYQNVSYTIINNITSPDMLQ